MISYISCMIIYIYIYINVYMYIYMYIRLHMFVVRATCLFGTQAGHIPFHEIVHFKERWTQSIVFFPLKGCPTMGPPQ